MLILAGLPWLATAGAEPVPPRVEMLTFPTAGDEGLMLEGELCVPLRPDARARVPGVVLCHPDPRMAGTMNDLVVMTMRDRLLEKGIATLRFNFRGVGNSQGEFGGGTGAVNDVLGALVALRARAEINAERCGIAGYSLGAMMGLGAAALAEGLAAYAGVALPTGHEPVDLEDYGHLAQVQAKLLFVTGTADQYSSLAQIRRILEHYQKQAEIAPLEGADHFYLAAEPRGLMAGRVAEFMAKHLTGEP